MIVWHVTSRKKLLRYLQQGMILPPVRAWKDIKNAEMFSIQTGRRIILRLKFPDDAPELDGHRKRAVVYNNFYPLSF